MASCWEQLLSAFIHFPLDSHSPTMHGGQQTDAEEDKLNAVRRGGPAPPTRSSD